MHVLGQLLAYALFAVLVGYFSRAPTYGRMAPGEALIRLSFSHAGDPKGECRRFTPEEIADMAPNMRRPLDCPRERVAVLVELELDGELLWRESLPPAGLAGDGPAAVYRRFAVAAGTHRIAVRLRDSNRAEGFDHAAATAVDLAPGQSFAIDFHPAAGGFQFF